MIKFIKMPATVIVGVATAMVAIAAHAASVDTIATGLNNPRGLALGSDGTLYVAESGLGAGNGIGGSAVGIGPTGAVTAVYNPKSSHAIARRVVTGLASFDDPALGDVNGPEGVSILGNKIYITETQSSAALLKVLLTNANSLPDSQLDVVAQFGKLLRVSPGEDAGDQGEDGHRGPSVADIGGIDYAWTDDNQAAAFAPMGQFPDANPYAVLALPDRQYVADAAANTIDEVLADGSVRIAAYLPNPSVSDAVPTCVALGSDHKLYVGTLAFGANFAFKTPQSKIYRFDPHASAAIQFLTEANVWASGFFPITGCGFGSDGFYVTEFYTKLAPPSGGDVVRITVQADGSAGARTPFGGGVLSKPNGFAGANGSIYVSNNSTSDTGSVVRITP